MPLRKLQQFFVAKFNSGRLADKGFCIERSLRDLRIKQELVALADSQVLRTIRRIRYDRFPKSVRYSKEDLEALLKEKKFLVKTGKLQNSLKIRQITEQINEMLYMPEYVL